MTRALSNSHEGSRVFVQSQGGAFWASESGPNQLNACQRGFGSRHVRVTREIWAFSGISTNHR